MSGLAYIYNRPAAKTVFKAATPDFPIFNHHPDLVYLDSAATTHKPKQVIRAITDFYETKYTSTGRGLYPLATAGTRQFETTRQQVAQHFGVAGNRIAFTKSATESINIVASGFLLSRLSPGDEVIVTTQEHHANFIPWQQACLTRKASLIVIPVDAQGVFSLSTLKHAITGRTRFIAVTHITNVLGTINPIDSVIELAHQRQIPVLVDAAQSAAFCDTRILKDADFIVCSAHKMFGPQGLGILYAAPQHEVAPLIFGGGAIRHVQADQTLLREYPYSLEAGTPDAAAVAGLNAALGYIHSLNTSDAVVYVHHLTLRCYDRLKELNGIEIIGGSPASSMLAFTHNRIHPHDLATGLAQDHICVRAGHHCAQPLADALGISGSVRVSFSIYNSEKDIDKLLESLNRIIRFWS
ncbi:MAG TPA: cysteine desulfurase [Cyclobacteriaceae bacterium]|nr:cysteine desulfurase [Cyclobacteriaceae bacterium]